MEVHNLTLALVVDQVWSTTQLEGTKYSGRSRHVLTQLNSVNPSPIRRVTEPTPDLNRLTGHEDDIFKVSLRVLPVTVSAIHRAGEGRSDLKDTGGGTSLVSHPKETLDN